MECVRTWLVIWRDGGGVLYCLLVTLPFPPFLVPPSSALDCAFVGTPVREAGVIKSDMTVKQYEYK